MVILQEGIFNKKTNSQKSNASYEFVTKCKDSGKFDEDQIYQIQSGAESGIAEALLRVYADPRLSADQMSQLKHGILKGANVSCIADPRIPADAMAKIYPWLARVR